MKKALTIISVFALLAVLVSGLAGCSKSPNTHHPSFEATVLEVYEKTVLVEVAEDASERQSADKLTVPTEIEDADKSVPELHVGDRIRVFYDGTIAETYPGQVNHVYAIELLENGTA